LIPADSIAAILDSARTEAGFGEAWVLLSGQLPIRVHTGRFAAVANKRGPGIMPEPLHELKRLNESRD
jgi:hypothetical protein